MKRLSAGWLLGWLATLLAAAMFIPAGLYVWHLESQRSWQDKLEEDQDVTVLNGHDHWLTEWLPQSLAKRLPETGIHIHFYNQAAISRYLGQVDHVRGIGLLCEATEEDLSLILALRQLEEMDFRYTSATDETVAMLTSFPQLGRVRIEECPISDASLTNFARMPALRELILRGTNVTIEAAEAFAAKHPRIEIACDRFLTDEETRARDELAIIGVKARPSIGAYIARQFRWRLELPADAALTPSICAWIDALNGPIVYLEMADPLTSESLDFITARTTIETVKCSGFTTRSEVEQLAALAHVKTIVIQGALFREQQLQELFTYHGDKIDVPGRWIPCY